MNQKISFWMILDVDIHRLYLGNLQSSDSYQQLYVKGIKTIISINTCANRQKKYKVHYHDFAVPEEIIESSLFTEVVDLIETSIKQHSVLVLCQTGQNLGPIMIMAYLIKCKGWTYEKSYYYLKERNNLINPKVIYRQQLMRYCDELQAQKQIENESVAKELRLFSDKIISLMENQNYYDDSPSHLLGQQDFEQFGTKTPAFQNSPKNRPFMRKSSIRRPSTRIKSLTRSNSQENILNYSFNLDEIQESVFNNQYEEEELSSPQFCEQIHKRHRIQRKRRNKSVFLKG